VVLSAQVRLKSWLLMHALLAAGLVSGGLMAAPGKASDETVYSQGPVKARYTITVFQGDAQPDRLRQIERKSTGAGAQ
jgi:hypothetical protein